MNVRPLLLTLVLANPFAAQASPPASTSMLTVDCGHPEWPSLREFAEQFGFDAFDPAYRVRQRMIIKALRACRRGGDQLQVVLEPDADTQAMVARRYP
ncbi:hypothetical protein [Lysobacter niastensis]|uniref:Uncharacterized protein n=1 Tax=Lysobacter niastensis TaxID=380629 RepID=A0ABS0B401_9GAMM|nr:hypothetical protein [Lysobacter niastensis]MBF6023240.1 hypothetical protein [Lysobacter niastensis]